MVVVDAALLAALAQEEPLQMPAPQILEVEAEAHQMVVKEEALEEDQEL